MVSLYDHALCADCYKVRLLLSLLGLEWETRRIDFHPGREHQSELRFAMARADKPLDVREAVLVNHREDIHEATDRLKGQGMLLVRGECDKEIVGVLTAFDLLV